MTRYNAADVRRAIPGREAELLQRLGGLTEEQVSGRHGPCPKCQGTDRFRHMLPKAPGALICNQCRPKGNGTLFDSLIWLNGWTFSQAVNAVGEEVAASPATSPKPSKNGHKPQYQPLGPEEAIYDYVDTSGRLVFQVVRHRDPKTFRQRQPGPAPGQWIKNLDGVQRVLYRADVLAAQKPGATVYVVEGEKDVANLEDHGLVATTCAGGAKNWSAKHGYAKALDGLNIVIVGDNDEDGRRFVRDVANDAASTAKSIKIIELPGLPPKGDVSDFLVEHMIEEFLEIVEATPCCDWASFNAPKDEPGQGGEEAEPAEPPSQRFQVLTDYELVTGDHALDYWIPGVLAKGQGTILGGVYKSLKTSVAIDLAIALAAKGLFLGYFRVQDPARVLFMSAESGLPTIQETRNRICAKAGISADIDRLFWSTDLPRPQKPGDLDALRDLLHEREIDVVVCDPVYLMLPSDDVSNLFRQGEVLAEISAVCQDAGATLVLIHHARKTTAADFRPMELADIAMAGFAEFARQWILLSRRERYEPGSGLHRLFLSVGGSAGHSGLWGLDIDEGTGHGNRHWNASLLDAQKVRQDEAERKDDAKIERANTKAEALLKRVLGELVRIPEGDTKRALRERLVEQDGPMNAAIRLGLERGELEACEITKGNNKKTWQGFRIPANALNEKHLLSSI